MMLCVQKYESFLIVLIASVFCVGFMPILLYSVRGQEEQAFSAILSGKYETTPTKPDSTGTAKFQATDKSHVSYWVDINGIQKVNEVHIYNGMAGENGDAVVDLSKGKSFNGNDTSPEISFTGNITKNDLHGSLSGKEISELVNLMSKGSAYVNVHTDEFPEGAIRGQIIFAVNSGTSGGSSGTSSGTGAGSSGISASTPSASTGTGGGSSGTSASTPSTSTGTGGGSSGVGTGTGGGSGSNTFTRCSPANTSATCSLMGTSEDAVTTGTGVGSDAGANASTSSESTENGGGNSTSSSIPPASAVVGVLIPPQH